MASSPTWVYKQAFGRSPDDSLTILYVNYEFGTDFTCIFIKLKTTDTNYVESLDGELNEVSRANFAFSDVEDHPVWFNPWEDPNAVFFQNKGFGSPRICLSYSKDNGIVHFQRVERDM